MPTVTATELHDRTSELTDRAMENPHDPIVIEKRGKAAVVLVDARYFEGLLETLDILSDPDTLARVRRGIDQADAGEGVDHDEVAKEIGFHGGSARHHPVDANRPRRASRDRKPNHPAKGLRKSR